MAQVWDVQNKGSGDSGQNTEIYLFGWAGCRANNWAIVCQQGSYNITTVNGGNKQQNLQCFEWAHAS